MAGTSLVSDQQLKLLSKYIADNQNEYIRVDLAPSLDALRVGLIITFVAVMILLILMIVQTVSTCTLCCRQLTPAHLRAAMQSLKNAGRYAKYKMRGGGKKKGGGDQQQQYTLLKTQSGANELSDGDDDEESEQEFSLVRSV